MGFTPQRKQFRLKFQDEELNGLEVLMGSASIGALMNMSNFSADTAKDSMSSLGTSLSVLADSLVSWNLEYENGSPVPATLEGLREQDMYMIMSIISAWTEAISGVAPPLPVSSNSGETFQEVQLPMEALSPNHGN